MGWGLNFAQDSTVESVVKKFKKYLANVRFSSKETRGENWLFFLNGFYKRLEDLKVRIRYL